MIDGVRNNYGWHTQDEGEEQATGENGPFSVLEYVQYMNRTKVWGDSIMIQLISSMWGCRVTVLRSDCCKEIRFRHDEPLKNQISS